MGLVTPQQAAGMGGADKPAGAHAENTFQNKEVRQLVILVRYKPKPPEENDPFKDMSAAEGMMKGATGAMEKAAGAVEDAMSNIPGLDMFIKEKKKDSTAEKDYKYEYADWDKKFAQVGPNLQKINAHNKTDTFDFHATAALSALGIKGLLQLAGVIASSEAKQALSSLVRPSGPAKSDRGPRGP